MNDDDLFVAEVCHIRAALPGGPRYSAKQTDSIRRSGANLVLLCHAHHVVVDSDVRRFTPQVLSSLKRKHQGTHAKGAFRVSDRVLRAARQDVEKYWARIAWLNTAHLGSGVPAVRIDVRRDARKLFRLALKSVGRLEQATSGVAGAASSLPSEVRRFLARMGASTRRWDAVPYYENPLYNWCWEILHIGVPNWLLDVRVALLQLEILELERQRLRHGSPSRVRLQKLRGELERIAQRGTYVD